MGGGGGGREMRDRFGCVKSQSVSLLFLSLFSSVSRF